MIDGWQYYKFYAGPGNRAKYNINHLNDLAKIFKCSPKDFVAKNPL